MTNKISLQKIKIQQKLNKIKEQEAKLKIQEKKQHISQLIKLGEFVEKAQLTHLTPTQLYGALLSLKDAEKQQLQAWDEIGKIALNQLDAQDQKVTLSVKFPNSTNKEIDQQLKSLGLKWNSYRREWEGYANYKEIESIVRPYQGVIQELDT